MKKLAIISTLLLSSCASQIDSAQKPEETYTSESSESYSEVERSIPYNTPPVSGSRYYTRERSLRRVEEPRFENIVNQLTPSSFGYSVPSIMNISDTEEVRLIINPSKSESEVSSVLGEQSITSTIPISNVVIADLSSRDFYIEKVTPNRQVVDKDVDTLWIWTISPKSYGDNKTLQINVSALVNIDGQKEERFLDTYVGTVQVDITNQQVISTWLKNNWQWAWGALLIPILGFFWARKK